MKESQVYVSFQRKSLKQYLLFVYLFRRGKGRGRESMGLTPQRAGDQKWWGKVCSLKDGATQVSLK